MISIIIPTLNEESVIEKTLRSLKEMTLPHELIVSDGGSTDRTIEIARALADKIVLHSEAFRQNISMGRNAGAKVATGDFFVFLDADCSIPNPDDFFTRVLAHFEKNPKLVALTPKVKVFPQMETFGDRFFFGYADFNKYILNNILRRGESGGEFQAMPRTAFEKIHGFREDLITREDADMFLRLSKIGRTLYDPKLILFHTGRRAHTIGWSRLFTIWIINTLWVMLFNKAYSKEWKVVR